MDASEEKKCVDIGASRVKVGLRRIKIEAGTCFKGSYKTCTNWNLSTEMAEL